jgi:hypothetical protein
MKKTLKLIGIITFTVIIGFTLTAAGCDNGTTGGGGNKNNPNTGYTQSDLQGMWLRISTWSDLDGATITETKAITISGNNFTFTETEVGYTDGTKINYSERGTFIVSGSTITFKFDLGSSSLYGDNTTEFSISGNKLTLGDAIYIRQN